MVRMPQDVHEYDSEYNKPFRTVREQIEILKSREMIINDDARAEETLTKIGYYRLSGYWYPYRVRETDSSGKVTNVKSQLRTNVTLESIYQIYKFDQGLRNLIFQAIGVLEIGLRFQIGHTLGRRSAFAHRESNCLGPHFTTIGDSPKVTAQEVNQDCDEGNSRKTKKSKHKAWLDEFEKEETRSKETFTAHFQSKYGPHLPVWVATEIMNLGTLSQLYSGAHESDREQIAANLDLIDGASGEAALLSNWLNHLRHVRNISAHHSRLWNRDLTVNIAEAPSIQELIHLTGSSRRRVYGSIVIIIYLLARIAPQSDWREQIRAYVTEQTVELNLELQTLGFPQEWDQELIWQANYARDPAAAKRVLLLNALHTASNAETRDLLTIKQPKERRSWLTYLTKQHALLYIEQGERKHYPRFQIDESIGNIIPIVGDVNSTLWNEMRSACLTDQACSEKILTWWINPNPLIEDDQPYTLVQNQRERLQDLITQQASLSTSD